MKVREEMRIKQAIYGSSQAPAFVNGAVRKWHSSHQSREALIHSDYSLLTPVLWSFAMNGLWMIIFMLKRDDMCFLMK